MSHRLAITLLLLAPAVARADEAPERLLPASTQLYVRWDGLEAHLSSYSKTALGKTLQEDTGKFLLGVYKQVQDNLGETLTVPQLLGGVDPDKLQKLQDDVSEAPKLLPLLARNGFVLAGEVRGVTPPQMQLTLILPGAAAEPKPFLSLMRLLLSQSKLEIKETKLAPGVVYHVTIEQAQLIWWIDEKDAVLVLGTDAPEAVVTRARAKTDRLADHPQFKKVQAFKQFETASRGFLDTVGLVKLARAQGKEISQIVDDLGLEGLQGVRFYFGFEVPAERSLIEIDLPGPRKGVLALADAKPFTLGDLPPMPPDVYHFAATRLNAGAVYDVAVKSTEKVMGHYVPLAPVVVSAALLKADNTVGFNIRKDLLGSLGDTLVLYNSPTDGPVNLGIVALLRVKDEKKLKQTLDQLVKALGDLTGAPIKVQKRKYRNAELCEVSVRQQGFVFLPTYTVHDGWLALSFYPQPVQGFVLRSSGELPAWKPSAELEASLAKMPKEFVALSVSDPRPSVKQVLSVAPFIGAAFRSFMPESKFDVGALPNPDQATRHLFPNVTTVTDDGSMIRIQSRSSLQLPFDLVGIDSYFGSLFFVQIARFAF